MITVEELLSQSVLREFRLAAGRNGIRNTVRDSHLFESWNSIDSGEEDLHPGDFVITSLSYYQDRPQDAEAAVMALLKKNLAALCIKDLYFREMPEKVLRFADGHSIPLCFFTAASLDDAIFTVKNFLKHEEINYQAFIKTRYLIYNEPDEKEAEIMAKDVNPFFSENLIAACWIPRERDNIAAVIRNYTRRYNDLLSTVDFPPEISYSFMRFPRGLVAVLTDERGTANLEASMNELKNALEIDGKIFSMGLSMPRSHLSEISTALTEAVYSAVISAVDGSECRRYDNIGIAKFLCPLRSNKWIRSFYDDMIAKLREYDATHHSNLIETAQIYADSGGDIKATAAKTFQHVNTIRYRIEKIIEILDIKKAPDTHTQIFIMVRLHEILELMHENVL